MREGFDPAQARGAWSVQDLQHQFIAVEVCRVSGVALTTTDHRGFEQRIPLESGELPVHPIWILFHRQQPVSEQGFAHGACVVRAVAHQFSPLVVKETCGVP